jgi:hypothetical protein
MMTFRNNALKGAWPWTYMEDAFWLSLPHIHVHSAKFTLQHTPLEDIHFMTLYTDALYHSALDFYTKAYDVFRMTTAPVSMDLLFAMLYFI